MNISWSQSVLSRMRRSIPNSAYPPTPLFWPQLHESPINMRVAGTLLSRQLARDLWGSVACGQNLESKGLNAGPRAVSSAAAFHIFCRFCFGRKFRCHKGALEKLRVELFRQLAVFILSLRAHIVLPLRAYRCLYPLEL